MYVLLDSQLDVYVNLYLYIYIHAYMAIYVYIYSHTWSACGGQHLEVIAHIELEAHKLVESMQF